MVGIKRLMTKLTGVNEKELTEPMDESGFSMLANQEADETNIGLE